MLKKVVVAVVAAAAVALGLSAPSQAAVTNFGALICPPGTIAPNDRCTWPTRKWLYGVGATNTWLVLGSETCVGAKTNSDGTGGNALPFRCEVLAANQTIWTPGGNSNWGYATVINRHPSQNAHYDELLANHS